MVGVWCGRSIDTAVHVVIGHAADMGPIERLSRVVGRKERRRKAVVGRHSISVMSLGCGPHHRLKMAIMLEVTIEALLRFVQGLYRCQGSTG